MSEARAPAPDRALVERKRLVRRLLALEGRVLWLPEGLWLLQRGRVIDAPAWQAALQAGADLRQLRAALSADALLEAVSRQQLAAATHALAVLEADVDALTDTPARWLGGQRRDAAWLQTQRARVQQLSGWIGAAPRTPVETLCAWFEVEQLPKPDPTTATLAWLCDTPPPPAVLDGVAVSGLEATLQLIAEHGPRAGDQAARLLAATAGWSPAWRRAWWRWLVEGIDPAMLQLWPAKQRAEAAPPADWPLPAVRVYLQLAAAMLTRPAAARLTLLPAQFARLADARRPTLVALAGALDQLLSQGTPVDPDGVDDTLALADVALRLDGLPLPAEPPMSPDLLATVDPDFVAWLGEPALLLRYLSLRRALGEPVEISRRLRQDHALSARAEAERQVLIALPEPDPRRARLRSLDQAGDPRRTQRRLANDCTQLTLRWRMASVDQALQQLLARLIGHTSPRWDSAWRDAARLYLGLDQNHAELRALLRAAAQGDAGAWRLQLPGNRDWIARQPESLRAGWLDPPRHSWLRRGEACTLTAERDPLQALRMGLPFDSCLAIDRGCNRHSAVINALDANKWVVYLRDPRGRILARQLLAISRSGGLLGYRIYTSIGLTGGLAEAFEDYARTLAHACGIALVDAGTPETLNGSDWYDDGARAWTLAAEGESALQAYLSELGCTPTGNPAESLAEEAGRWAQARAGRIEALPSWGDDRAATQRNWQLLEARFGQRLWRMLGPERAAAYRLTRAKPELDTLIRLEPQLGSEQTYRLGNTLRHCTINAAGIRLALRRLFVAAPAAGFDDHGLEHALLDVLPCWVDTLDFAALAAALPTLARAIDHLAAGLPEDCRDCITGSEWRLLQALQRAWRRAPDPPRMLRLLQARHDSDRLPRWLLGLGARLHLRAPAVLPLFAAPALDREVLKALDTLLGRHPALRHDPLALAARLRHSDPDALDPQTLDLPLTPPWTALGDAIVHWPRLWPVLRRYARRPGDLDPLPPAEAYWALHTPTAWREDLPARTTSLDADADRAIDHVVHIGEASLLAATRVALLRRHPRDRADRRRQQERLARLNSADPASRLGACWRDWPRLGQPGAPPERLAAHPDIAMLASALLDAPAPPAWLSTNAVPSWLFQPNADRYAQLGQQPLWHPWQDHCRPRAWSAGLARQWLRQWPAELGEQWLIRSLQDGPEDLLEDGPPDWYQRLGALAARHCCPARWQALYDALPDALAASVFLRARGPTVAR